MLFGQIRYKYYAAAAAVQKQLHLTVHTSWYTDQWPMLQTILNEKSEYTYSFIFVVHLVCLFLIRS